MRDRLVRVESSVEHLAQTQERLVESMDMMRRTLTLNEGNRRKLDAMEDRQAEMDAFLKSRWYIIVTVVSVLAAAISIAFNVL